MGMSIEKHRKNIHNWKVVQSFGSKFYYVFLKERSIFTNIRSNLTYDEAVKFAKILNKLKRRA